MGQTKFKQISALTKPYLRINVLYRNTQATLKNGFWWGFYWAKAFTSEIFWKPKCYDVNEVQSKIWKNQPPNQPPCGQLNRKGQKEDSYAQCLVRFLITTFINYLKGFSVNWKLYRPIINKATPRLFEWTSFLLLPFHDHYAWWSYVIIVFHRFCKIISFQTIVTPCDNSFQNNLNQSVSNSLSKRFSSIMKY